MTPDSDRPSQSELSRVHRRVYDAMAPEYENRAAQLEPVTRDGLEPLLEHLEPRSRVLDVGCGAGLVAAMLASAGHRVVAIDLSPRMAALARRRAPGASVLVGDYLALELPEAFDAIVAFAFIHLFPAPLAADVLAKMRGELRPGGHLLVGTTCEDAGREGFESKSDFPDAPRRFRKVWTEDEFERACASPPSSRWPGGCTWIRSRSDGSTMWCATRRP